ncbi:Ser/Thr protein kinase [Cryptosporidium canis]|uniref:Ser/Thr protein kinase n=1 Tax=Cryptosporidium canis TaxID=195482 RepID=A0ABQ8P289_9CRYT|nr:Ser/Thr protein kinase [Cryptosporidium canis]
MDDFLDCRSSENDSVRREIFSKQSYPAFGFATISTMASLQGLDPSLFHDQFSPILGIDAKVPDLVEKSESRRDIPVSGRQEGVGDRDKTAMAYASAAKLKSTAKPGSEIPPGNDRPMDQKGVPRSGIRTLYRMESAPVGGLSGPLSPTVTRIRVNGLEMSVVPSLRPSDLAVAREVPSGFRNSDQLVEYYIGRVLKSANSLFYIEKKLQQALYGAVFLAFELEECVPDKESEKQLISHSSVCPQGVDLGSFKFDPIKSRVAIKVSSMSLRRRKPSLKEDMEAEVTYSAAMRGHRNVLEYSEIWQDSFKNIYVKMEYAEYEDLFEVMRRRRRPLTESEARWLFSQIFNAVVNLHSKNIAMRDLSLENILMFNREPHFFDLSQDSDILGVMKPGDSIVVPKITDPGQACRICPKEKDEVSNLWKVYQRHPRDSGFQLQKVDFLFGKSFRPPEAYQTGSLYDPTKVDVFCLGWMLLFTLTKYQPFETCRLVTDNQRQNSPKNEGFINSLFGRLVAGNNKDLRVTEVNGKSYISKDQNWSLIVNGRILDLFRKIKATSLSTEARDLIENMLIPDFRERFSMQNVMEHPWLRLGDSKQSQYFTPIMASTLTPTKPHKPATKQYKQSPNIVSPSSFFSKLEDSHAQDKQTKGTGIKTNVGTKKSPEEDQDSANNKANILISKVNNDYLRSMVKRTNDRLHMTRINIAKRKDSDEESLIRNLNSSCITDLNKVVNPAFPDKEVINQKLSNPLNKTARSDDKPPTSNNASSRKKNVESNLILDFWSFFSNGGGGGGTRSSNTLKEHLFLN